MTRIVQILGSLLFAALVWTGAAGGATAHPGHECPAAAGAATGCEPGSADSRAGDEDGAPAERRHTADHCVQFHCQIVLGLCVMREDSDPALLPREAVLPMSAAVPDGIIPDPPRRPPRIPS